ncbi:hypothetical protein [Rubritalea tangerina]|uniref:Glycine zipper domain-containing protein n=1 Tax=Rubritalea tangerina TaxID=430798 RepID=A0ABW4ZAN7_9BACT
MRLRTSTLLAILSISATNCSTPEQTSRAVKGGSLGAGVGGLMGGWSGAAAGAAVTGLLGASTATGDSQYGYYPKAGTPSRAQSGNTQSRSSGSMGYRF